jgi:hypothetical protein
LLAGNYRSEGIDASFGWVYRCIRVTHNGYPQLKTTAGAGTQLSQDERPGAGHNIKHYRRSLRP